ncbi:hypothetical protein [Maridesulfovibrio frigidus]|nr:hypothetical protein [Maridesulfovibrio frigidus]
MSKKGRNYSGLFFVLVSMEKLLIFIFHLVGIDVAIELLLHVAQILIKSG